MRYKIEINLLALKELKSKINLEEAVLLDYLYWLCSSPSEDIESMRIEKDGKKYTWFDYGFYIKETPILRGKTKATITPKIKKLEKEEFIKIIHGEDFRVYVMLLPKADSAFRKLNVGVKKTKSSAFRKLNIDNNTNVDNKTNDNIAIQRVADKKQIDELIDMFKSVNPTHYKLFGNTTQRKSMENLVKQFGAEKIKSIIEYLPKIFGKPYAPRITTPYLLEMKFGELGAYLKEKAENPSYVKIK